MTTPPTTAQSDVGVLRRVLLKGPREAFRSAEAIANEWRALSFTAPPDFDRALEEYDAFARAVTMAGAHVDYLPPASGVTLDSIYVRDASVVCDRGVILCEMGKPERAGEPAAQAETLRALGAPTVGAIRAPGRLEGGDVVWLAPRILAVGRGYRTNDDGIRQLRALLGDAIDELIVVPLPHWRGPGDVFHLMSIISPVDRDLAVVYAPLLPVPFRERLIDLGFAFVEVPDEEFDSMGANVLAIAPRRCVMVAGNPLTRARLEAAGAAVVEYAGREISLKGGGGPTCLTRPLARDWPT
ncbi:MAG TPA: arginine deiminase family protein [Vicinamibacterales bacterium]|nr:arginine deiminase family protein [Vicinamibacterales bacterium]